MKKETTLCMGCMSDKGDSSDCTVCGYSADSIYLASYLAPSTFLSDRYIIGKLISYNGEGALYLAYDTETETKVTIKEYMPETLCTRKKDEETITVNPEHTALYKTYLSEFIVLNKALMSTDKGNLQRVLDVFSVNNTAYVVYEYVIGMSLKTYLAGIGGVLTWSQVRRLFSPVLETLRAVHIHGILHRGLSPTTLLVSDNDEIILIGFAITAARTYGSDINFEVFSGYAPPELYCTTDRHGSWTDVYGISAVLYKVLTGQTPSDAIDRKEHDELIHPLNLNSGIPKDVSDILMRGLSLDADKRFQTVAEFLDRLLETPENPLEMGLFKKPPVDSTQKRPAGNTSRKTPTSQVRKQNSNTTAVLILFILALTILGFIAAITIPAMFPPDNEDDNVTTVTTVTSVQSPVTSAITETTTQKDEPLYRVPDFSGRPFEAIRNSGAYNYLIFNPVYEYNDEFAEGLIFEQSIDFNTEVAKGTELTVKVSEGSEIVNLPEFTDVNRKDYAEQLTALKIKFETVPEDNAEVKKDVVIRCSVEAGSEIKVSMNETIIVYYSTGKAPKENEDLEEIEDE